SGLPLEEIAIQLDKAKLEALGLELDQVADRIARLSQDLPAGEIGNEESTRQIRSLDQGRNVQAFAEFALQSDFANGLVKLEDVATIERRPLRKQMNLFYQGQPAIELE